MVTRKSPAKIRRRAVAWFAALLVLAAGLSGGYALVRVAALGYCRGELQGEADRTAVQVGKVLAGKADVDLAGLSGVSGVITLGQWDMTRRQFRPGSTGVNAVQVVAEGAVRPISPQWLRRLFLSDRVEESTRAVAAVRPRDIVFVVDLSGAMTAGTREALEPILRLGVEDPAYPEVGGLRQLYADLGYEAYPGRLEPFAAPWQVGEGRTAYEALVSENGPLSDPATNRRYRIEPGDPIAVRRHKAYQAVIDRQIMHVMPQARPRPNVTENFDYWAEYLDDVLDSEDGTRIGYASYIRFMLERGRVVRAGGQHVALSQYSGDCPWHADRVADEVHRFPPETQPMHDVRRGLVAALRDLALRNRAIADSQRDRVAIVTFDSLTPQGAWVEQPLTNDYSAAAKKSARLQAVGERARTTGAEALELAKSLLRRSDRDTPWGRDASQLVVFVTAGPLEGEGAVSGQIARMTQLGQTVRVIPVGRVLENAKSALPTAIRDSQFRTAGQSLSDGREIGVGDLESSFRSAIVPASVVLVE